MRYSSQSNYGMSFTINTSYSGALPAPQHSPRVWRALLNNGRNKICLFKRGGEEKGEGKKKKKIYILKKKKSPG